MSYLNYRLAEYLSTITINMSSNKIRRQLSASNSFDTHVAGGFSIIDGWDAVDKQMDDTLAVLMGIQMKSPNDYVNH